MKNRKIVVIPEKEEDPLPLEIFEKQIRKLSNIGKQLDKSRLTQRAIILLLADITKLSKSDIKYVLNALPELERYYLKPEK